MALIYESDNFTVEAVDKPLVDRNDGGHISINPKRRVKDRQALSAVEAIELMRLTMITGEAMTVVMNEHGVDVKRINYQDNGNWGVFTPEGPYLHIHLYGRAASAKYQKYGQACYFPHRNENPAYYENFKPLNSEDVEDLKLEINRLIKEQKYADAAWRLSWQNTI